MKNFSRSKIFSGKLEKERKKKLMQNLQRNVKVRVHTLNSFLDKLIVKVNVRNKLLQTFYSMKLILLMNYSKKLQLSLQ